MAVRDDLIEVFNVCIDRLNAGETPEVILLDYPQFASQLRPMVEAGRLITRARVPAAEVQAAAAAGEPRLRQAVREVFGRGLGQVGWLLLLVTVGGGLLLAVIIGRAPEPTPLATATATATVTASLTATATATASPSSTVTVTPTTTLTPTVTSSATLTASATVTHTAHPTHTAIPTAQAEVPGLIRIEGPVSEVQDDVVIIYDVELRFDQDDPLLTVIRPGDILRIEGRRGDTGGIDVLEVVFISVTVVVYNGEVWRGDDCALPPPAWAQAESGAWAARCVGSTGGDGGSDDDDDD